MGVDVLATLQFYKERLDKAEAEIDRLKKQLYDARDSKFAAEIRKRGRNSFYNYVLAGRRQVYNDKGLIDFDDWSNRVVCDCWLDGLMTKDEFIEEFNQELSREYEDRVAEYEEEHGDDRA